MKVSKLLLDKLKSYEELRLQSYKCPAGVWTIGWGHTYGVKEGQIITEAQAETLLNGDLLPVEKAVSDLGVWTQGQFDALVDFAFNCGIDALMRSTLLKKIRLAATKAEITAEFLRWNKAKGVILEGLTKRRQWEAERYFEI